MRTTGGPSKLGAAPLADEAQIAAGAKERDAKEGSRNALIQRDATPDCIADLLSRSTLPTLSELSRYAR